MRVHYEEMSCSRAINRVQGIGLQDQPVRRNRAGQQLTLSL